MANGDEPASEMTVRQNMALEFAKVIVDRACETGKYVEFVSTAKAAIGTTDTLLAELEKRDATNSK